MTALEKESLKSLLSTNMRKNRQKNVEVGKSSMGDKSSMGYKSPLGTKIWETKVLLRAKVWGTKVLPRTKVWGTKVHLGTKFLGTKLLGTQVLFNWVDIKKPGTKVSRTIVWGAKVLQSLEVQCTI